jgi:hypothetical protein
MPSYKKHIDTEYNALETPVYTSSTASASRGNRKAKNYQLYICLLRKGMENIQATGSNTLIPLALCTGNLIQHVTTCYHLARKEPWEGTSSEQRPQLGACGGLPSTLVV